MVEGEACILLAVLLLTVPLPWLGAGLAAAAFHELCHVLALTLLRVRILSFRLGAGGAVLETEPMGAGEEVLAALAGPLGSFLLLSLAGRFPRLAFCGLVQGCFNLLPVWPLDGGRAVFCLLKLRYSEEKARKLAALFENLALLLVLTMGVLLTFVYIMGIGPLLVAVSMVMKAKMRKTPCQDGLQRVQ